MNKQRTALRRLGIASAALLGLGAVVVVYGVSRNGADSGGPDQGQQTALVRKLLERNEPEKALALLDQMRTESRRQQLDESSELLQLRALEQAGLPDEVAKAAPAFLARFPESKAATEVQLAHLSAEVSTAGLARPNLLKDIDAFIAANPTHPGVARLQLALAQHALSLGDTPAARRRLNAALALEGAPEETVRSVKKELGDLNLSALLAGNGDNPEVSHTVAKGESVWVIAKKYGVTPELLMEANGIDDPKRLRIGQTLRVPTVDFSLSCDIGANELVLLNAGKFVKSYNVRTGRVAGTTPPGTYRILNKKKDPTWRPGDGRVYGPDDPNNELGTRWMAFEGDILGIHGTLHPETLGHYASNGCIGMSTEDVEELFDLIDVGVPLTIIGEQNLTRSKVIPAPSVPPPQGNTIARAN